MSVVKIAVEVDGDFIVQNVFTKPGMFVQKDEVLFSLKDKNSNKVTKIKAPAAGKADKVHKSKGNAASKGYVIFLIIGKMLQRYPSIFQDTTVQQFLIIQLLQTDVRLPEPISSSDRLIFGEKLFGNL